MSTKNNPGAFRCFEAALPDEPIFTILGRDPAAPATLRFWAQERAKLGKLENPDDVDRIDDAVRDASVMYDWRAANLDPLGDGGPPAWHSVTVNDELGGPIRVEPDSTVYIYAERDGDEAVRLSIEWLRSRTRDLVEGRMTREFFGDLIEHACQAPDRRRERVVPVEEAAFDAAKRDARTITMMDAIQKAIGLLDDIVAPRPNSRLGAGLLGRLETVRRNLFNALTQAPLAGVIAARGAQADKTNTATVGEQIVVDSQPSDLAHAPEVPPHRFSVFHKGESYAYARGLEINPMHLPTALDAMEKDGWSLVAIFGQTDSQHVGFIFKRDRRVNYLPSRLHRLSPVQIRPDQGGIASDKSDRFLRGDPLEEIREDQPRTGPLVTPIETDPERFVIEWATRLPDGEGCSITRAGASEWPDWAQPCFNRGRSMMP